MTAKRLIVPALLLAVVAAVLGVVGYAGATGEGERGREVPRLSVAHLDGDGEFELGQLASAPSPTLVWFWAPWCESCNEEAPAIERLAVDATGELTVVAIGGSDEPANGMEFASLHGLRTPTLLFDEPEAAFDAYGVSSIPTAVLLDRSGRERDRWVGGFDTAEVLDAARDL